MDTKKQYQASLPHFVWIQFVTGIITLWCSFKILFIANLGETRRQKYDRIISQWAGWILKPIGLKINTFNPHNQQFSTDKPIILMCNHSSLYDIPVSFIAIPHSIRMLTKKELFRIPVLSKALRTSGFVSVDRQNSEQARKDLIKARQVLETNTLLWIAPEGTRTADGKLKRFKKGGFHLAIETGATIIPIGIEGINEVLPPRDFKLIINGEVNVHIGKEIDAAAYPKNGYLELLNAVESEMRHILKQDKPASVVPQVGASVKQTN